MRSATGAARTLAAVAPAEPVPDAEPGPDAGTGPGPRVPAWGLGEAFGGWVLAVAVSAFVGVVVVNATGIALSPPTGTGSALGEAVGQVGTGRPVDVTRPPPLAVTALLQVPLWATLLAVPLLAARRKGNGAVDDFGIRMRPLDVPVGLAVGAATQLMAVPALYWLLFLVIGRQDVSAEARELTDRADGPVGIVLVFLIVAVAAPVVEEVFFRGLTQRAFLKRGVPTPWAVAATSVYFGATHLQPLQFPALVMAGAVFGVLAVRAGRLGPAIWAHLGFNAVAAVTLVWELGGSG
jgi:membrane protease YdiL (CAAX protease family)